MTPLSISEELWGNAGGTEVHLYTLTNASGMRAEILDYGGIIRSLEVPDRASNVENVVLGLSTLDDYVRCNPAPTGSKRLSRMFHQRVYAVMGCVRRRSSSRECAAHMKPSVTAGSLS